jgi:hypothetical protein
LGVEIGVELLIVLPNEALQNIPRKFLGLLNVIIRGVGENCAYYEGRIEFFNELSSNLVDQLFKTYTQLLEESEKSLKAEEIKN